MDMYTFHLFAGSGGGILADLLTGHTPIGAVEIEEYPRKVLLQRQLDGILPVFPIWDDVSTFRMGNPDCKEFINRLRTVRHKLCISGGFPCQDISIAGKGEGINGSRSGLWFEMARIIGEIQPRFAFLENSPMLVSRGLDRVLSDLAKMGYDARWGVVGSADTGRPHVRKRIWILAHTHSDRLPNECPQNREHHTKNERRYSTPESMRLGKIERSNNWINQAKIMDDGMAGAMDELKALGNGQDPTVASLAWKILTKGL